MDQRLIGRLWFLGVPGLLRRQSLGRARRLRRKTRVASRHDTLRGLAVAGALALAAGIASAAYASVLPTLLVTIRCAHPVPDSSAYTGFVRAASSSSPREAPS